MFWRSKQKQSETLWLIAGLGNFGPEYEDTRHNCGFRVIDVLADRFGTALTKRKFKGILTEHFYREQKLILLKPLTYMNNSGESIQAALHLYKIPEDRMIVIYDDADLAPGKIRIRPKGSAGSHNGMKSILLHTNTEVFPRVRVGIGKKPEGTDMIRHVLGRFRPEEQPLMEHAFVLAADAVLTIVTEGTEKAMARFN